MTCNRIDAIEAAVERVTEDQIQSLRAAVDVAKLFAKPSVECDTSALDRLLHALAEANERASLLQTAVHERCAERDEARGVARIFTRHYPFGEKLARDEALSRDFCALPSPTALNPQQEGSRDHG